MSLGPSSVLRVCRSGTHEAGYTSLNSDNDLTINAPNGTMCYPICYPYRTRAQPFPAKPLKRLVGDDGLEPSTR
jgi:hypothetical protein